MFSFRTYIRPLKALQQRREVMQRLLAAFTALPEDVVSLQPLLLWSAASMPPRRVFTSVSGIKQSLLAACAAD